MTPDVLALVVPGTEIVLRQEILLLGLVHGLGYGLLGVGLLLTYRSTRVINFAHGEIGAVSAGLIPLLVLKHGWSYWLALPLALMAAPALGALTEVAVIRPLRKASRLVVLIATIGLSQLLFGFYSVLLNTGGAAQGLQALRGGFPVPFDLSLDVGLLRLNTGDFFIIALVPPVAIALTVFFTRTRVGLEARAASESDETARLAGIRVNRVSLIVWTVAGLLAGISAILLGPTRPLALTAGGPVLLVRAIAAVLLAGMGSFPAVFAGGVAIGLVEATVSFSYPTGGALELVLFAMVLASLLLRRRQRTARDAEESSWSLAGGERSLDPRLAKLRSVRAAHLGLLAGAVAVAALVPAAMSSSQQVLLSGAVCLAIIGLSVVVLAGFAGQVSLGQFAFAGVGAAVGARLDHLGHPAWAALIYAGLAGAAIALVIGLPALRIKGLFLAVTTLSFALAAQSWLFSQPWLVGEGGRFETIPRPAPFGFSLQSELRYYWLTLAAFALLAGAVYRVKRTGAGRAMIALRDNEPAAAALGVPPARVKLAAFVLAGVIASIGGYFYGGLLVGFQSSNVFVTETSVALLAMVVLGGATTITGVIAGVAWVRGLSLLVKPLLPEWFAASLIDLLVSGPGLLIVLLFLPGGLSSKLFDVRDRVVRRLGGGLSEEIEEEERLRSSQLSLAPNLNRPGEAAGGLAPAAVAVASEPPVPDGAVPAPQTVIEARDIVVRFGGNTALAGVSIHAERGEVVGLVGPNGAGKTTLFDVLSGHVRADAGTVWLDGREVTYLRPESRARRGLGRTFQQARLFGDLRVVDVFKVAFDAIEPSEIVPAVLSLPASRDAERRKDIEAEDLVDLMQLRPFAYHRISELSTGTRRIVELGTAVAAGARVLLLDEPSAGVAQRNVGALQEILGDIRRHLDCTVVLIEHNIPLVTGLADRVYVLTAGELLVEGAPQVLRDDPRVVEAYLGRRASGLAGTAKAGPGPAAPRRRPKKVAVIAKEGA